MLYIWLEKEDFLKSIKYKSGKKLSKVPIQDSIAFQHSHYMDF